MPIRLFAALPKQHNGKAEEKGCLWWVALAEKRLGMVFLRII